MRQFLLTSSLDQEAKQQNTHQTALVKCIIIIIKRELLLSPSEIKIQYKPLPISTEFEWNGSLF